MNDISDIYTLKENKEKNEIANIGCKLNEVFDIIEINENILKNILLKFKYIITLLIIIKTISGQD